MLVKVPVVILFEIRLAVLIEPKLELLNTKSDPIVVLLFVKLEILAVLDIKLFILAVFLTFIPPLTITDAVLPLR